MKRAIDKFDDMVTNCILVLCLLLALYGMASCKTTKVHYWGGDNIPQYSITDTAYMERIKFLKPYFTEPYDLGVDESGTVRVLPASKYLTMESSGTTLEWKTLDTNKSITSHE